MSEDELNEQLEAEFVCTFDALDDYMTHHERLRGHLKEAYLCLARARYSMGAHRVSSSQFDSHLGASKLIGVSASQPHVFSILPSGHPLGSDKSRPAGCAAEQDEEPITTDAQVDERGVSDSNAIITELEQKFVLSEPTAASKCTAAEDATFRTPVQMLGGLVSPHLHQAQEEFEAVLKEAVAAATAKAMVEAASKRFLIRKHAKADQPHHAEEECKA